MTTLSKERTTKLSKALSYWLRHKPEAIGLKLDKNGWASVKELMEKSDIKFSFDELKYVVDNNDKKRFELSEDFCEIRAAQGHSIEVDLQLEKVRPPMVLFHGTAEKNIESILKNGIEKRNRHAVHLSKDIETASKVGMRHGKLVLLEINTGAMYADGFKFEISSNGVYLTEYIPAKYIKLYEKKN